MSAPSHYLALLRYDWNHIYSASLGHNKFTKKYHIFNSCEKTQWLQYFRRICEWVNARKTLLMRWSSCTNPLMYRLKNVHQLLYKVLVQSWLMESWAWLMKSKTMQALISGMILTQRANNVESVSMTGDIMDHVKQIACLNSDHQSCHLNTCWHHAIETLSTSLALCEGNSPVTSIFPTWRASDAESGCFITWC